jgi:hypothetical protein
MNNITTELVKERMEKLGLSFMAAGFDSFLNDQSRREDSLLEVLTDLIDLEYHPRKERMARTRLKVSGIPVHKRLEDFDLSWSRAALHRRSLMSFQLFHSLKEKKI